jgi:1-acyl-sn-glycerol-3-phosphate acyltransferase
MIRHGSAQTSVPVRLYRISRLLIHLFSGVFTVALLFPFYDLRKKKRAVRRWSARLLAILNVVPRIHGSPPRRKDRSAVLVANHVSWLDIQLIHSVWQVRFVAKSEVRRWPIIGWLSACAGTLFVERSRSRHAAHINRDIHAAFERGDAVGVFPEGTTSEGTHLHRFHASLLQPAVDEHALVYPVALRYLGRDGKICVGASYVGETSLLESISTILAEKKIVAELFFLPAIDAEGKTRRQIAAETREAIALALGLPAA